MYLTRYAEEQQDLALLSISTFQRALKVTNIDVCLYDMNYDTENNINEGGCKIMFWVVNVVSRVVYYEKVFLTSKRFCSEHMQDRDNSQFYVVVFYLNEFLDLYVHHL